MVRFASRSYKAPLRGCRIDRIRLSQLFLNSSRLNGLLSFRFAHALRGELLRGRELSSVGPWCARTREIARVRLGPRVCSNKMCRSRSSEPATRERGPQDLPRRRRGVRLPSARYNGTGPGYRTYRPFLPERIPPSIR